MAFRALWSVLSLSNLSGFLLPVVVRLLRLEREIGLLIMRSSTKKQFSPLPVLPYGCAPSLMSTVYLGSGGGEMLPMPGAA